MTATTLPKPDVDEMRAVHDVFRDVLAAAPSLLGDAGVSDPERAAMLRNFYENVIDFLAIHHAGEDELMFPLLEQRCAEQLSMVQHIAGQHHDVHELVGTCRAALASWQPGNRAEAAAAGDALRRLGERLVEHLDEEERNILPLCAEHLTLPEWGAMPAHGMMHFAGDKIWLVLGLIRERMTQSQRDEMLAHMPPPAVEMWTGFGEQAFNQLMEQVGSPLR